MDRKLKWQFSKENLQMAKRHVKRCSVSQISREIQIKATMRYHFILVKMAISKNCQTINAREGVEKKESSYTADSVNWCSRYGE